MNDPRDVDSIPWGEPAEPRVQLVAPRKCRHPKIDRSRSDDGGWTCICGYVVSGEASRRGRNAKARGLRKQRERIVGLGGRNLAGNNENLDGTHPMFAFESKSGGSFPERAWRWLKGIPHHAGQVPVLIITDAPGPGHRSRSVVIVDYDDWRDLHGEDAA